MITTLDLLSEHPFLAGMTADRVERLSLRTKQVVRHRGYRIFREGGHADRFWLIRAGEVALDLTTPDGGNVVVERLGAGTVLGWSWLFPPYEWHFGAVADEEMFALELDGWGVRSLCEEDPALGYDLSTRFLDVLFHRLQATRAQRFSANASVRSTSRLV